jgi:hypothetical protein
MSKPVKEIPADAPKVALIELVHGTFLAGCGIYGSYSAGWAAKAMHSAYAGTGAGVALGACAALTAAPSYKMYMIGVHLALVLQVVFTGVFGIQAFRSFGVPAKADRFPLFVAMGLGSLAALGAMYAFKPKKKKA